ncbi:DUF4159 domain-containing protein [Aliishimia ponticola]|uniref:DUF4159 domain-containing protein n=1 Tax=Aliishimia ponticola TaxID=2499833 RepID=A0A4S4N8E3_9RHOB|nr:DUF4159 domain-containing protein [Aliishimia ponticola]THH34825.1 DUF4159 domain-containing protein [Aliishimia ponticola]
MMGLGSIGFTAPWLLLALIALPILWLILRAVPPAPIRRRFPGVALLLGLGDDDTVTDRTPWWLLLLRLLAVAALIVGLAGPVLNSQERMTRSDTPILVIVDGSWAGAPGWQRARAAILGRLDVAVQLRRPVGLLNLSDPAPVTFQPAQRVAERLAAMEPNPWQPGPTMLNAARDQLQGLPEFDTVWLSDGLDYAGRGELLALAQERGTIQVLQGDTAVVGLRPATYEEGEVRLSAIRSDGAGATTMNILAQGRDPAGNPAVLERGEITFGAGDRVASLSLTLPDEIRDRVTHFSVDGTQSTGATTLVADSLRRVEVALIASQGDREALQLLSPLHYVGEALSGKVDLLDLSLNEALPANPDAVLLADVAILAPQEQEALQAWVEDGGMLIRFAGPRVAASDISRDTEDPLMPVRLRLGGRSVGGAMSWGEPKGLADFAEDSPFVGLDVPADVTVTAQVLAQPGPELSDRVIAQLTDGTPVVTRKPVGLGQVVLFHVTANAEWSNLPLSVLFIDMLERLMGVSDDNATVTATSGDTWQAVRVLDGTGSFAKADALAGVSDATMSAGEFGPAFPPGVYQRDRQTVSRNALEKDDTLEPATWPATVAVTGLDGPVQRPLGGPLLAAALVLLMADILASLALSGRLTGARAAAGLIALALMLPPLPAQAQDAEEEFALNATSDVVLAHVMTGNDTVDDIAQAGLRGLSDALFFRTSVEPAEPIGVNLETDELAFFPMLYWPITPEQPRPSAEAYAKLNEYLRSGGLILFDTRDADITSLSASSPNARKLQQLAAPLDVPRLEKVPNDHVLTRTFYLLQDFPGRHTGRDVWVEAAPPDVEAIEGMPFRNLNDNVTPVVIGSNDWAAAWAVNQSGAALLPIGRGFSGERQRELAYRFGINLVMHVLTGNYKSDQVHVPALLDRLGQ